MDDDEHPNEYDLSSGDSDKDTVTHPIAIKVCSCNHQEPHVTITVGPILPGNFIDALNMFRKDQFREIMLDELTSVMARSLERDL